MLARVVLFAHFQGFLSKLRGAKKVVGSTERCALLAFEFCLCPPAGAERSPIASPMARNGVHSAAKAVAKKQK